MINQDVIIENTKQFVKSTLMSAEGGHDWFHVERVFNTAIYIAKNENASLFIVKLEHYFMTLLTVNFIMVTKK